MSSGNKICSLHISVCRRSFLQQFTFLKKSLQGIRKSTIQIQISAVIQTTHCIQFQRMQFHMIRSFCLCPMCKEACVFTIRSAKAIMNFN